MLKKNIKIGFLGGMNAMPMGYALKFMRDGYDVKYIVESKSNDYLMRPEHQYAKEINYPYAPWIIELVTPYSLIGHAFPGITYRKLLTHLADRDVIFLNDFGLALASKLPTDTLFVALCSGSDLDVFCNYRSVWSEASNIRRKWLTPFAYALGILRVFNQRKGLKLCSTVCYFPKGLNPVGDNILHEVKKNNPKIEIIPRYDVNFHGTGIKFTPIPHRKLKKIIVPVRFNMNPVDGSAFEYKGNDMIIEALAKYKIRNNSIEIKFFLKGPSSDIAIAKQMCDDYGLSSNVAWLEPLPLSDLLKYYYDCDICIDQVGTHWMGAVGMYALYGGRPLITNARPEIFSEIWGDSTPILQAKNAEEIYWHLVRCEDYDYRYKISMQGHEFALKYLDTEVIYKNIVASISAE